MSIARTVLLISGLLFGIGTASAQEQAESVLTATTNTALPVSLDHFMPVWSGGALLVVEGRDASSPTVYIINKDGDIASRFTIAIPGMYVGLIYDHCLARGSDGTILIAGSAATEDADSTTFLATIRPDGTTRTVIRLSPFHPDAATIAADGTIWVAGAVHPKLGEKADTDQYLIRRYSPKGELLTSSIKWTDITARDYRLKPAHLSRLMASKDRVAWYSPTVQSYMEFSLDGKIMTKIKSWTPLGEYAIDSPVLCDDGSVFAGEELNASDTHPAKNGIFTLKRDTGTWNFEPREKFTALRGCEGNSVAAFSGEFGKITWFEPAQPQKDLAQAGTQQ
jgi:hypothetical protein